MIALRLS